MIFLAEAPFSPLSCCFDTLAAPVSSLSMLHFQGAFPSFVNVAPVSSLSMSAVCLRCRTTSVIGQGKLFVCCASLLFFSSVEHSER